MSNTRAYLTLLSVSTRRPTSSCLASFPADTPASATTSTRSHAYTIYTVHTGATCFIKGIALFGCLIEGADRREELLIGTTLPATDDLLYDEAKEHFDVQAYPIPPR